jgi:hypothetical protein
METWYHLKMSHGLGVITWFGIIMSVDIVCILRIKYGVGDESQISVVMYQMVITQRWLACHS